jgi:septal ring factor EnvC (AmiA/AmiB activator)
MTFSLDTKTLTEVINYCFDNSMDERFSGSERASFRTTGKKLRGYLMNLLTARFDEAVPMLVEANGNLKDINAQLKKKTETIENAAARLQSLNKLVKSLDKLLGAVGAVFL